MNEMIHETPCERHLPHVSHECAQCIAISLTHSIITFEMDNDSPFRYGVRHVTDATFGPVVEVEPELVRHWLASAVARRFHNEESE